MRALVISPQPFFSPRGTPFSVYYRTLITAELGVTIDLLTYGQGEDVDIPGVSITRIPRFRFLGNVKIGPSFLKLFLDVFLMLWAVMLLIKNRYDFVHAHEESVFFCRFLQPIFRFKLVYDMHSSLPQQLTNFKFTRSKLLIGTFTLLENSCLRKADAIITICPDLANYVNSLVRHNNHALIENSIFDQVKIRTSSSRRPDNTEAGSPRPETVALPENRRFVVYAGTLEPYQGIELLIDAFAAVVTKSPEAYLLIVGGTPLQVANYAALVEKNGFTPHCLLTGQVAQHLAKRYSQRASVLVSPRIEGTNTPLKIYEQLASGIPLVATSIYSHTQVLNDSVAFLVEPNAQAMAQGILMALDSSGESKRRVANALKLYEQHYSRPVYVKKLEQLLESLS